MKNTIHAYISWYKYTINVPDLVNAASWFGMSGQLRLHSRGLSDVNNSQIRQRSRRGTICSENGLSEKKSIFFLNFVIV